MLGVVGQIIHYNLYQLGTNTVKPRQFMTVGMGCVRYDEKPGGKLTG